MLALFEQLIDLFKPPFRDKNGSKFYTLDVPGTICANVQHLNFPKKRWKIDVGFYR